MKQTSSGFFRRPCFGVAVLLDLVAWRCLRRDLGVFLLGGFLAGSLLGFGGIPAMAEAPSSRPTSAQGPSSRPTSEGPLASTPQPFTIADLEALRDQSQPRGKTPSGRPFYGRLPYVPPRGKHYHQQVPWVYISYHPEGPEGLRKVSLRWTAKLKGSEDEESVARDGMIDGQGYVVIPFVYIKINPGYIHAGFGDDLKDGAVVQCLNGKWGAINATGRQTVPCVYREKIAYTNKGLLRFTQQDGKIGLVRLSDGKIILPFAYQEISRARTSGVFLDELEAVKIDGLWGFVDIEGRYVIPPDLEDFGYLYYITCPYSGYIRTSHFSRDTLAARRKGRWGVLDRWGRTIVPFKYDDLYMPRKDGRLFYRRKAKEGFIQLPPNLPQTSKGAPPASQPSPPR